MLERFQKICFDIAGDLTIDGIDWESVSKSTLINKYVDNMHKDSFLSNRIMAAIVYRYWDTIDTYYRFNSHIATPEDCFDWVTNAILYAVEKQKWRDPLSVLHKEENAPDRVVNIKARMERLTYYQYIQYGKRKANLNSSNFDFDFFITHESELNSYDSEYSFLDMYELDNGAIRLIKDSLDKNEFLRAFIIDGIINSNVFLKKSSKDKQIVFKKSALKKYLTRFDLNYLKIFCNLYNQPMERISTAIKQIQQISSKELNYNINKELKNIKGLLYKYIDKNLIQNYEKI